MKNHIVDATITAESTIAMTTSVTNLRAEIDIFGIQLDDAERKHSQKLGTRNETFAREMLEFARQNPNLVPAGIDVSALQRDLVARDQITPVLFQLKAMVRTLEDTHTALGIDLFNGTRALYKVVKPIAAINGVKDIITRIGLRFARPKRTAPEGVETSTESTAL